jgi:hypothetical protein
LDSETHQGDHCEDLQSILARALFAAKDILRIEQLILAAQRGLQAPVALSDVQRAIDDLLDVSIVREEGGGYVYAAAREGTG